MKKLGCDFYGAVIDFFGYLLPFANERLGTNLRYDQFFSFDPAPCFGLSSAEFKEVHDAFHREVYQHDETPKLARAFEALERLCGEYELHFITAAQDHLVEVRTAYLERHFPGCHVHFTNGYATILGSMPNRVSKFEKAIELGVDYMIDDNPKEIEEWDSEQVPLIIFPQPWNASVLETHPHVRRWDWDTIEANLLGVAV
jgi:5'(3')-deoxyribonucleotidase